MRTDEEQDRMHDAVVARFPGGLNFPQFKLATLESADADDDGRVYPPHLADLLGRQSWIIRMMFDGLLDHLDDGSGRPRQQQPMNSLRITEKGKKWLAESGFSLTAGQKTTD